MRWSPPSWTRRIWRCTARRQQLSAEPGRIFGCPCSHAPCLSTKPGTPAQVVDVGGGTGFCTQGIVKHVRPQNVTLIDQSPDQLNKARQKADLQGVTIVEVGFQHTPGSSGRTNQRTASAHVHCANVHALRKARAATHWASSTWIMLCRAMPRTSPLRQTALTATSQPAASVSRLQ